MEWHMIETDISVMVLVYEAVVFAFK